MSTHIASLNLFREADGTYQITVAGGSPEIAKVVEGDAALRPIDHIENRVLAAATGMAQRKRGDGTFREIPIGG